MGPRAHPNHSLKETKVHMPINWFSKRGSQSLKIQSERSEQIADLLQNSPGRSTLMFQPMSH